MQRVYDYLIVGSGLFGATFAHLAHRDGKRCLVIERRPQLGGNVYCEEIAGIHVHKYGAHIFHTNNKQIWDFVNGIVPFNRYTNCPVANYKGKLYNLPFNMNTFYQMWGVTTPEQAAAKIEEQKAEALAKMKAEGVTEPRNLEEQALLLVGNDIYEKLIKGYTEKQWGRPCTELPSFIIKRLPVRLIFDNNYFNDACQGIPIDGYNKLIEGLLEGVECRVDTDFFEDRDHWMSIADKVVFTGPIDAFYDYRFGQLEWRTVRFEQETLTCLTIRVTLSSTIRIGRHLIHESSSISISRVLEVLFMRTRRQSSFGSTVRNGNRAWSRSIPSMMRRIVSYT